MLDVTNKPDETVAAPSASPGETAPLAEPSLEVDEFFEQKKLSSAGLFSLAAVLIVLVAAFFLYLQLMMTNSGLKTTNAKNSDVLRQLGAKEIASLEKKIGSFSLKAKELEDLRAKDIFYEKIIKDVALATIKNARINSLALDEKGNVKIDFELKDVPDITKQLLAFEEKSNFREVKMSAVSIGADEKPKNTMTISFRVSPGGYK